MQWLRTWVLAQVLMGISLMAQVEVVSVSSTRVVLREAGMIRSVEWDALPDELRKTLEARRVAAVREEEARVVRAEAARERAPAGRTAERAQAAEDRMGAVVARFGDPVEWRQGVDLRPRFRELDLWVKAQGRRPSCAVFAVVGALEFQAATATGEPVRLSEEYLLWATRRMLGQARQTAAGAGGSPVEEGDRDEGFSLLEVVQALRIWGIPSAERVPNRVVGRLSRQEEPPEEVILEARGAFQVGAFMVPGRSVDDVVANIVHLLNGGVPVVVGLRWPHERALRRGVLLRSQRPRQGYAHAVTLVGYRTSADSGEVEFIFRNSWGPEWGAGGYGYVALSYLGDHLLTAIFLDVAPRGR